MRTNLNCKKALTTQAYEKFLFFILCLVYDLKSNLNFEVMKFCSLKVRLAFIDATPLLHDMRQIVSVCRG